MALMKEFRDFAMKGNVVDMAVGIIVGAAFGKIVSSLVKDVIMPPIGLAIGGVDFSNLKILLKAATEQTEEVAIMYGQFIQTVVDFLIVAGAVFVAVKVMNNLKKKQEKEPEKAPDPSEDILLLREIRDAIKSKNSV